MYSIEYLASVLTVLIERLALNGALGPDDTIAIAAIAQRYEGNAEGENDQCVD